MDAIVRASHHPTIDGTPFMLTCAGDGLNMHLWITPEVARSLHADLSAILEDAALTTEAK